jgi:hypothetical protein
MALKKKIFISYASQHRDVAESIALRLRSDWVDVFFDRDKLPPGREYDKAIHDAIMSSSLFIFLASPEAFAADKYTLTEIEFARSRWPNPDKCVLTVMIKPTEFGLIPQYLKKNSILEPKGNVAAEVRATAERMLAENAPLTRLIESAAALKSLYFGPFMKGRARENLGIAKADRDDVRPDLVQVLDKLKGGLGGGRITVKELKERLGTHAILREPQEVQVTGVFFPGALLSFGWWERSNQELGTDNDDIEWKDRSLQKWLFSGFQEWAPSWDLNNWSEQTPLDLVGQIGTYDEADSIPVLVKSGRKAKEIRDDMAERVVANATVLGWLCHQSHFATWTALDQAERALLSEISKSFSTQYCILIKDGVANHNVDLSTRKVDHYSGYVWHCVSPKEWTAPNARDTQLPSAYFVWEHTNLADRDVRRFGLDSLDNKVALLQRRLRDTQNISGELTLLQHLTTEQRLRGEAGPHGEPAIPTEYFREIFSKRAN